MRKTVAVSGMEKEVFCNLVVEVSFHSALEQSSRVLSDPHSVSNRYSVIPRCKTSPSSKSGAPTTRLTISFSPSPANTSERSAESSVVEYSWSRSGMERLAISRKSRRVRFECWTMFERGSARREYCRALSRMVVYRRRGDLRSVRSTRLIANWSTDYWRSSLSLFVDAYSTF